MRSVYEPDYAEDDDATAETGMSRGKQWFVVFGVLGFVDGAHQ
jgi:hypothetical protein